VEKHPVKITSDNFKQGDFIPEALAWGRIGEDGSTVRSTNLNPQLSWTDAPEGTASFVLACLDDDVPTDLAERDASGEIPVSQPRRRFVHWVQPNCPADVTSIAEGALAEERKTREGGRWVKARNILLRSWQTSSSRRCLPPGIWASTLTRRCG